MAAWTKTSPFPWLKPAVLTGSLVPIAAILVRAWGNALGADPIAQALNQLGLIALVFLVAALGCTPLKAMVGWTWPMRLRRMLGLLAFFYAGLHVITYTVIDHGPPPALASKSRNEAQFPYEWFVCLAPAHIRPCWMLLGHRVLLAGLRRSGGSADGVRGCPRDGPPECPWARTYGGQRRCRGC